MQQKEFPWLQPASFSSVLMEVVRSASGDASEVLSPGKMCQVPTAMLPLGWATQAVHAEK